MAATRVVRDIRIVCDDLGDPIQVVAKTHMEADVSPQTIKEDRTYSVQYIDLGSVAQGRINSIISDVEGWLNANDPLT